MTEQKQQDLSSLQDEAQAPSAKTVATQEQTCDESVDKQSCNKSEDKQACNNESAHQQSCNNESSPKQACCKNTSESDGAGKVADDKVATEADLPNKASELKGKYRKLVMLAGVASVSTAMLLIAMKFAVWLFSGSATILASLTDSMIDLGASFINLLALRYALMPPDRDHRFGHYKAEALASLSQAAFISGSAFLLIINGYDRVIKPHPVGYIDIAIYVSIASIVLTVLLTLFQGYVCKVTKSEAIAADRFHYISDVGLNLTVILSLVLSKFEYEWADGVIAILLGLYILKSSWHIGYTAVGTLLDKSMSQEENTQIIETILDVDGVESFHDLRTRKAGPQTYIQCHLVLDANMSLEQAHNITDEVEHRLKQLFGEADINLHMEPNDTRTYTTINFFDHLYCQLPENFYTSCTLPKDFYTRHANQNAKSEAQDDKQLREFAIQRAAEAARSAELAAQAARAAAQAASEVARLVMEGDLSQNSQDSADGKQKQEDNLAPSKEQ